MAEATCRREIELEIPADAVEKAAEKIARDFARVARIPGFRPGKAPVTLIRRRFAADIKSEVLQSLVPDYFSQAVAEKKMVPVTEPHIDKVDYAESGPIKFRAVFEVLPEFEVGGYKEMEVEVAALELGEADVDKTLEQLRERAATFVPVEGRAIADGDYAQVKLTGIPQGGGGAEPIHAEDVLCHIGGEETIEAFNDNLRGAHVGEQKRFEVRYPGDYPDPRLASKAFTYTVEIRDIKQKKLPELDDNFARDVSDAATLAELRERVRKDLEKMRERRQAELTRDKIIETLVAGHDFPVPTALVEQQMDTRLERVVRQLTAQGVDPRAVNVDWVSLRRRQNDRAVADVKAELLLDRIATAEGIDATEEEVEKEIAALAERSGESATVLRSRLTKQGALDRMRSKLRTDKTLEWLCRTSRVRTTSKQS